ncbi:ribosomal RNA small subunit methyltransferase A [Candidatus Nomurabacteria bacterium]|nr:ribosomal RNA small subunit methyltransferase A [Candidatus Nomurabacteria bacterium]
MIVDLYKPTYLKALCQQYGLSPSKKYGQNYLITDAPIKKMLEAAGVSAEDTIVEIGPGFGVLTFALLEKAKKLIAFEIEKKLHPYWDKVLTEHENFEVIWGNALSTIPSHESLQKGKPYKVVANLPYQITSNVLRTLLELPNKPQSITVMVQKEVAQRICAMPGEMSLLSVCVQYFGIPKVVTKVSSGCFWPAPKVDSAVVHIDVYPKQEVSEAFFTLARAGFSNKRKQLAKNLAHGIKKEEALIRELLEQITGNSRVRAQELSMAQWKALAQVLSK